MQISIQRHITRNARPVCFMHAAQAALRGHEVAEHAYVFEDDNDYTHAEPECWYCANGADIV